MRLPNGQIQTFSVLQDGPDLPIGDPNPGLSDSDCFCDGGDDDIGDDDTGDDDYGDPDEGLPEPDETSDPTGVVSIVDPDEDGEFPEWEL